jgi:hypothetical protein
MLWRGRRLPESAGEKGDGEMRRRHFLPQAAAVSPHRRRCYPSNLVETEGAHGGADGAADGGEKGGKGERKTRDGRRHGARITARMRSSEDGARGWGAAAEEPAGGVTWQRGHTASAGERRQTAVEACGGGPMRRDGGGEGDRREAGRDKARSGTLVSERFQGSKLGKFGRLFAQEDLEHEIWLGFHAKISSADQMTKLAHLTQILIPRPNSMQPNTGTKDR